MDRLRRLALATRPWSFTAAAIPVLVTSAVLQADLLTIPFGQALTMALSVQAAANLTNTYYDFANHVDTKETAASGAGEDTLVNQLVSAEEVLQLSVVLYAIALLAALPTILTLPAAAPVVVAGVALAFFYTADPVGLKYKGMGDVTIFLCFGPLLMQATSLVLTGGVTHTLWLYSVPIGLLTEAILHANNARDIKADRAAGAVTLAGLVGFRASFQIFVLLVLGSYASVVYMALWEHWGCGAALLTAPLAIGLCRKFDNVSAHMKKLPEEVAKLHLPFGVLLFLGIRFTRTGLLQLMHAPEM
eukprot:TRINITY_DN24109_c0_g1_i1.p1 TRINITY_DN24109_c0_g1~~TRINITY_DN24109_c0_g1_i1.p1  ORF type:complete len:303 (-),score=90.41 TRINITY_DN24109_c0_g1_i1:503-1411(-)